MHIRRVFSNGLIHEEVYVSQSSGFENFNNPSHVFKLKNALYSLKHGMLD